MSDKVPWFSPNSTISGNDRIYCKLTRLPNLEVTDIDQLRAMSRGEKVYLNTKTGLHFSFQSDERP